MSWRTNPHEWHLGFRAGKDGDPRGACPFAARTAARRRWLVGWDAADRENPIPHAQALTDRFSSGRLTNSKAILDDDMNRRSEP